jgi:hypothetical protein
MSEDGYLQLKIRENNEEIDKIKNELFESKLKISNFEKKINEMENKFNKNNNEIKNIITSYNVDEIKNQIKEIANNQINKILENKVNIFLEQSKNISKKTIDEYKNIAQVEATDLYDRLIKDFIIFGETIFKALGECILDIHKVLVYKKIILKPFEACWIIKNFKDEDIMYTINFKENSIDIKHGKKIAKHWNKKIRLYNPKMRVSTMKVPINDRLYGKVIE